MARSGKKRNPMNYMQKVSRGGKGVRGKSHMHGRRGSKKR